MKKHAIYIKAGDVLDLANGKNGRVISTEMNPQDPGGHDMLIHLEGLGPAIIDMWTELEVVEGGRMRIRPIFAWYDLWVGAYWDRQNRRLYVLPLPCIGIVIEWGAAPTKPEREPIMSKPVLVSMHYDLLARLKVGDIPYIKPIIGIEVDTLTQHGYVAVSGDRVAITNAGRQALKLHGG